MAFNQSENPYASYGFASPAVAYADVDTRAAFIRKTYLNLGAAILAFIGCCAAFYASGIAENLVQLMQSRMAYFLFFLGFVAVAWACESWAHRTISPGQQYAALGVYVVAEALFFAPVLFLIARFVEPATGNAIIGPAALITLFLFFGMTAIVVYTAKDFSWLRGILWMGSLAALGILFAGWIFGFSLGIVFTVFMIALACGYILYDTSNVMRRYPETHAAAAALSLFASLALLFWYVLRLVMYFQSRD